jgi:hypothetical protein
MEPQHMIDELGLTSWDATGYGFYFTKDVLGKETHGSFGCKEEKLKELAETAKSVFDSMETLNQNAKALIQKEYPDEDVDELSLDEMTFNDDGSFQLGYPTGESVAGHEYIYVKFQKDFTPVEELIYEYY